MGFGSPISVINAGLQSWQATKSRFIYFSFGLEALVCLFSGPQIDLLLGSEIVYSFRTLTPRTETKSVTIG